MTTRGDTTSLHTRAPNQRARVFPSLGTLSVMKATETYVSRVDDRVSEEVGVNEET